MGEGTVGSRCPGTWGKVYLLKRMVGAALSDKVRELI